MILMLIMKKKMQQSPIRQSVVRKREDLTLLSKDQPLKSLDIHKQKEIEDINELIRKVSRKRLSQSDEGTESSLQNYHSVDFHNERLVFADICWEKYKHKREKDNRSEILSIM